MSLWIVSLSFNNSHMLQSFFFLRFFFLDFVDEIFSWGFINTVISWLMAHFNKWRSDHLYSRSRFYIVRLLRLCFHAASDRRYWPHIWSYLQLRQIKHHNLLLGVHYSHKLLCQGLSLWWEAGCISCSCTAWCLKKYFSCRQCCTCLWDKLLADLKGW